MWKFVYSAHKTNTITPCYYDNDRYYETINLKQKSKKIRLKIEILCSKIFSNRSFIAPLRCVLRYWNECGQYFSDFWREFSWSLLLRKKLHQQQLWSFPSRMSPKCSIKCQFWYKKTRNYEKCFRFISLYTVFWWQNFFFVDQSMYASFWAYRRMC